MNPVRIFLLASLLLGAAVDADASTLYKCTAASGLDTIQSSPCPKGSTQVWKRDSTPDPGLTPTQASQLEARQQKEAQDAHALSVLAGTTPVDRPPPPPAPPAPPPPAKPARETSEAPIYPKGPCRLAHEFADAIRDHDKDFLEMRQDQLARLDRWVENQCRDPDEP